MKAQNVPQIILAMVLCFTSLAVSQADEFQSADFMLDDHAALIPVLEGVRRVRVSYLDDDKKWQAYSMAHLAGDEGQIKLRLPDQVSLSDVRVEVSYTDPFPYEVYKKGRSDFVTEVDGSLTSVATAGDRAGNGAFAEDGIGAAPAEVQESDLWKWKGETLYFYNQLRGLQVFDFSDPTNPKRIDSIRMPALGEDMYLHPDGEHLILLAKRWSWGENGVGSEAVVVRHNENGLSITNRIPLPGSGVVESRMVGSHLYVAMRDSRRVESVGEDLQTIVHWESGLTVEHTDLSDPGNPVTSEPLNLFSADGWWYNATVSATSEYFIVSPYVYDRVDQTYKSTIHLIDIRDQSKPLKIAASTELDGHLKDKFKLRIRDNILTCITQGGRWNNGLKTIVANYDLGRRTDEGEIPLLDRLVLAPQETLFATRFDGDRVYVVTAIRIDPLFVVDLSEDDNLRLLGELKIPGWSHYLQPRSDRLLSVGVEDRRVAISQFDVSDPENMGPPLRVYLGEEGSYSWSEGNYDEQAIGYFPERGVMILPFQSYSRDWTTSESALQILTFDDDSLEKAGVIKTDFAARRATLIDDATLVSVSGREVNSLDVSELSDPKPLSSFEAAWTVDRVIPLDDYVLQIEAGGYQWYGWYPGNAAQKVTLRITSDDALDIALAKVELAGGSVAGVKLLGDSLHVLTTESEQYEIEEDQLGWRQVTYHHVVDLTDPTAPSTVEPVRSLKRTLHGSYHARQLEGGRIAWIPEINNNYWGGWFMDFRFGGGPGWYGQSTCAQILIVDSSDPSNPALIADYQVGLETNGPVDDEEDLKVSNGVTISGIVEHGEQIYLTFQENILVTGDPIEGNFYRTDHKLRVVTLPDSGDISVAPAVSVPGTVEGVREVGDEPGLLLLSSAPATRTDGDRRIWWSSDLILQTSAFDGLTAFLIDEVTIPNAYYNSTQITHRHFAVSKQTWHDAEVAQGIEFYPFTATGEIGEAKMMELEFYPNELTLNEGVLAAAGWGYGQQVWWMLNTDTIDDQQPVVVQIPNRFYVNFDQTFYDRERLLAWVPVGAYGVETIDIADLFSESAGARKSRSHRTKGSDKTWERYQLSTGDLTSAGGDDVLGPLAADEIWRYQPIEPLNYDEWMARQLGEEGNPDFVAPLASEDSDGDGRSNWNEFAFGTNPMKVDTDRLKFQRVTSGDGLEIEFHLPRGHQGVTWEVQASRDLEHWEVIPMEAVSAEVVDVGTKRMVLRFSRPNHGERSYFRLNFKQ